MKKVFSIILFSISVLGFAQSDPVAVDDTVQVLSQVQTEFFPLLNDYDPDGDTIEIAYLTQPDDGYCWYIDSSMNYKSYNYEGWDKFVYNVRKVNDPTYLSDNAVVCIEVLENPDVPVAVNDTFHVKLLEATPLDILDNDYDINGDAFKIHYAFCTEGGYAEVSDDSSYIVFTSYYHHSNPRIVYTIIEESEEYVSLEADILIYLDENEDLPVAINDTLEATGGITAALTLMENDHNPLGDTLEYIDVSDPDHGNAYVDGTIMYYSPYTSYTGDDDFNYSIRYKNQQGLYSQEAKVVIHVDKNPDCPVGVPDYGSGMAYTEIAIEVLSNDREINGDSIEIMDVYGSFPIPTNPSYSGDTVYFNAPAFLNGTDTIYYKIRRTNDPSYYSEWIPIILDIDYNPAFPRIVDDSASVKAGSIVRIDFWENDIFVDSIDITNVMVTGGADKKGRIMDYTDSTLWYCPYSKSTGTDSIFYYYSNFSHPAIIFSMGWIHIDIEESHAYDSLTINNINAGFNSSGMHFAAIEEIPWEDGAHRVKRHFETPKGSGKHTMYCNTIWIGGEGPNNQLHIAAERYRLVGTDIQPGPVQFLEYDSTFFDRWNRMWKLKKEEVEYHIMNWWKEGYEPIETIASWPGNGDADYNIPSPLAPYHDHDGNGIYDPGFGDYPLIRGDECIYFICNDVKVHSESQGLPLYLEIHGMAYAYDAPYDSILNNTVFVHYDLINRSENTYYDTYFGIDNDFDLGYGWDDYIASHVMGNSFFAYNAKDYDGYPSYPEPGEYEEYPPAQSVTILAGPYFDPDGQDNPTGSCDYSLNGFNFDNGIIDDERHGLSYFMYYGYGAGSQGSPSNADHYWTYLQGRWKDGSPIQYGNTGYGEWASGPDCRYMFPGDTDPQNWGTECVLPNDGYTLNGKWWTMEDEDYFGTDVKGLGTCGPFTFHPGDVQEVDLAYMFANSYHSADSSKRLLIERLYELRQRTLDGEIIIPNNELIVNEVSTVKPIFYIYPNPVSEQLNIKYRGEDATYSIINTMGMVVLSGKIKSGTMNSINIISLKPGIYIISISSDKSVISNKFIKL